MSETPRPADPGQPSPAPAEPPAPAAPVPAPFPQVLRTPWVNPAKRTQVAILAIIAFLVVAGAAFVGGVAAGDGHGGRRGPDEIGYACYEDPTDPGAGQCAQGPMRGHMLKPGRIMMPRYAPYPYSPPSTPVPAQSSSPSK